MIAKYFTDGEVIWKFSSEPPVCRLVKCQQWVPAFSTLLKIANDPAVWTISEMEGEP